MKWRFWGQLTIAVLALAVLLVAHAEPSHAFMGTGGGFHGNGVQARSFQRAGFNHQGFLHTGFHHVGFRHGFRHHSFFFHRPCCFGPRVFIGLGVGVPLFYPYTYPAFPTSVAESAPPVYVEAERQYWYYCQGAHMYYPYVRECPGGWLQVVPQPSLSLQ
jgi:hypothetical protein